MLRLIFVFSIIVVGGIAALQGPFHALLFYLWYAYFRPEQWVWSDYVSALNLSLVVGIWLLVSSVSVFYRFRLTRNVWLVLLMAGQSTVSMLLSEHSEWSLSFWVEFMKVLTVTVLITFVVSDGSRFRLVLLVIMYSLGFEAAKQGWAQFVLNPGALNNNTHPVLGDNNGVAVGMMMLLPVAVALARSAHSRAESILHWIFAIGFLYRGLSTYSRGGFLAALAIGLIIFWQSKHRIRVLLGAAVLAMAISSVMPDAFWQRMQTIRSEEGERDDSAAGRLFFWETAVHMANANPLTGVGLNAYSQAFASYETSGGQHGTNRAVHSAWFGVLAETGYPGLLLLVATIVTALRSCRQVQRACAQTSGMSDFAEYAGALRTSFVAYIVGMTFLNGQYSEMFWHFVGLTAALSAIVARSVSASSSPQTSGNVSVGDIVLSGRPSFPNERLDSVQSCKMAT